MHIPNHSCNSCTYCRHSGIHIDIVLFLFHTQNNKYIPVQYRPLECKLREFLLEALRLFHRLRKIQLP